VVSRLTHRISDAVPRTYDYRFRNSEL
jgi:hypothetical protein